MRKKSMRIFIINVSGTGLDLSISKINDQQFESSEVIKQLKPQYDLYGTTAESTIIEIIDEDGEPFDSFNFNELSYEDIDNLDNYKGMYQVTESFEKGLFNQFELALNNDESINYNLINLLTKIYNGEQYVCGVSYDNDALESIGAKTNIIERKTKKIKL